MNLTHTALQTESPLEARFGVLEAETVQTLAPHSQVGLSRLPRSFTSRRIPDEWMVQLSDCTQPKAGDLVLVRVERLGQHRRLHLPNGRRRQLFEGDELIAVYGNRYASDQFESTVPDSLSSCHLVAGGGLIGWVEQAHSQMNRPTQVQPIGLICQNSWKGPLNVKDAALNLDGSYEAGQIPVVGVVGTSMNSGKTTVAACLTRGLTRAGYRVGYAKVTGTSAACDPWLLADAGAQVVLDCVDAGYVTTYRLPFGDLKRICMGLIHHCVQQEVDIVVVEVADGVLQSETAALLESDFSRWIFNGFMLAAGDSMGAAMAHRWLQDRKHQVLGISGVLTGAPLQMREASLATRCASVKTFDLEHPLQAANLVRPMIESIG